MILGELLGIETSILSMSSMCSCKAVYLMKTNLKGLVDLYHENNIINETGKRKPRVSITVLILTPTLQKFQCSVAKLLHGRLSELVFR